MRVRRHRVGRDLAVVLLLVCGLARAQGQNPPVIHVDVNLVQVDAVVTDSRNRHVSTLQAADFEILQDGKLQDLYEFLVRHFG